MTTQTQNTTVTQDPTGTQNPSVTREPTQEEENDRKTMDIFTYLKKHTSIRKCSGCRHHVRMLNRRYYCALCAYLAKRHHSLTS